MEDKVDISIVIVNYNVKEFLYQCLLSIRKATDGFNVETIVVDNNSSDNSIDYLEPLFPEVKFIKLDENIGFGRANNLAFKQARGKYFLILNPDTIIQEDTLRVMYDYMEAHPEVGISGCKVLNADGTFQLPCRRGFPTPWAAFCKLFGLQSIFPKSRLFAQYNQTFRDENETYYIDAIIGAFMFSRGDVIRKLEGFLEDFFMYGEDLDLCFRANKIGYKTAYVHTTSIIHYKGESTRRSSINDIKHFYEAMEIFAKKNSTNSTFFLLFLKMGIKLRQLISILQRYKVDLFFILVDILGVNVFLLLSTYLRFDNFFNFPSYAYPKVFFIISAVVLTAMISIGEYFEKSKSIKQVFSGYLLSFFFLSSLTYYFKEYAFSRGVLLMTIFFSIIFSSFMRMLYNFYKRLKGSEADKNIVLVGYSPELDLIIDNTNIAGSKNANILGYISISKNEENHSRLRIIGNIDYLDKLIKQYNISEVIFNNNLITNNEFLTYISKYNTPNVRFHLAKEYNDLITSRIIDEITPKDASSNSFKYDHFRVRFYKRIVDILIGVFGLSVFLPISLIVYLSGKRSIFKGLASLISGKKTLIGVYPSSNWTNYKSGIFGLAHITNPDLLTQELIDKLNHHYLKNYSLSLDIDVLIKSMFRKKIKV